MEENVARVVLRNHEVGGRFLLDINEINEMTKSEQAYGSDQIQVLEGLESVLQLAGM